MLKPGKQNIAGTGRKRILLPMITVLLVLCYIGVFAWYFIYGFGNEGAADGHTGELSGEGAGQHTRENTRKGAGDSFGAYAGDNSGDNSGGAGSAQNASMRTDGGGYSDVQDTAAQEPPTGYTGTDAPAVKVKGLYVAAWYAGMDDRMARYIELCDASEINTLVIDVKDEYGQITFLTDTEGISESSARIIPDIKEIVATLKSHGIYTIARVVCFKDPARSSKYSELAIRDINGEPWKDSKGETWLDPYKVGTWEYIAAVSLEAAAVGFDEVQLDYVRFPSEGKLWEIDYGPAGTAKSKAGIISEFTAYIRAALAKENVRLSADVFGIIAISDIDAESIGQDPEMLLHCADYLSPMIYPSHFANKKQNGTGQIINSVLFEAPDLEPYGVVYNILLEFKRHMDDDSGQAGIRPYLQDFTASYLGEGYYMAYSDGEVMEQIDAVYDAGFDEWILWNHYCEYSEDAFKRPGKQP